MYSCELNNTSCVCLPVGFSNAAAACSAIAALHGSCTFAVRFGILENKEQACATFPRGPLIMTFYSLGSSSAPPVTLEKTDPKPAPVWRLKRRGETHAEKKAARLLGTVGYAFCMFVIFLLFLKHRYYTPF